MTSRATHAHPTSPRSTGFCAIWDCISSSSTHLPLACLGVLYSPPICVPRCFYTPGRDGTRNAVRRPGSGGRPRGCGFEEQGKACARIQRGYIAYTEAVYPLDAILPVCVCTSYSKLPNHSNQAHTFSRPIFKHAQHTHAALTPPLGDTPNTRVLPQTLALRC